MAKVIQPDCPPEWQALWDNITHWFGRYGVPTWVANWFQTSRRSYEQRIKATKITEAKTAWKALDDATKHNWKLAAYRAYGTYKGYSLFIADYIYRKKVGLSLPGTYNILHQLFGLEMTNAGGANNVYCQIEDKDRAGKIRVRFSYKKIENTPSVDKALKVRLLMYYLKTGAIDYDLEEEMIAAGNIDWSSFDHYFGVTDRQYFHVICRLTIDGYDAIVYLDNLRIAEKTGEYFIERWNVREYKVWYPVGLVRKRGWSFSPSYIETYFKHLYLQ